jgi:hypothetical protein
MRIPFQGFDNKKIKQNLQLKIFTFFGSKIAIYLSLSLYTSYRRSLHPSRTSSTFLLSWVTVALLDPDLADQYECGSGSTTLAVSYLPG